MSRERHLNALSMTGFGGSEGPQRVDSRPSAFGKAAICLSIVCCLQLCASDDGFEGFAASHENSLPRPVDSV